MPAILDTRHAVVARSRPEGARAPARDHHAPRGRGALPRRPDRGGAPRQARGVLDHRRRAHRSARVAAKDDTLWLLYSNTKVLTACAVWLLVERGALGFTDKVAEHLPGFEQNGKGDITIIQLLTHQGGFPNADVPKAAWTDHDLLRKTVCDFTLEWTPGSRVYYHGRAAHWTAAAMIEARHQGRLPRLHPEPRSPSRSASPTSCFVGPAGRRSTARAVDMHEPAADSGRQVKRAEENNAEFRRAGTPGGGGYATARAMAAFYQMMAHGGDAQRRAPALAAHGQYVTRNFTGDRVDGYMGMPMHRGLGPHSRGTTETIRGLGSLASPRTFGHGGVGSSYCWADPDSGVSFAYLTNSRVPDPWHSARLDRSRISPTRPSASAMAKSRVLVTGMSGLIGRALRKQIEGRFELRALNRSAGRGRALPSRRHRRPRGHRPGLRGGGHRRAPRRRRHEPEPAVGEHPQQQRHRHLQRLRGGAAGQGQARRLRVERRHRQRHRERRSRTRTWSPGRYDGLTSWPMLTHLSPVRPLRSTASARSGARCSAASTPTCTGCRSSACASGASTPRTGRSRRASSPSGAASATSCGSSSAASTLPATLRYDIVFGTSRNKWGYRDLEHTRAALGWEPMDAAEDYR